MLGADEAPYHVVLLFLGFLAFAATFVKCLKGASFELHLDPPIWIFVGLIALGLIQIIPMPLSLLKWVSPAAFDYRTHLLPQGPDLLDGEALPWSGYSTISFHPYGTKQFIYQIIALTLFYIISRSSSDKVSSINRLCWCLMANGSILALFAISQSFTSPRDMVFWTMPYTGDAFGTMNRDHYPDYMCLCIGASCALLTVLYHRSLTPMREKKYPRSWERMMQPFWEAVRTPLDLLQKPGNLWNLLGLIFMIASVPMTGSRGGFGAMILGFFVAAGLASQNLKKGGLPGYILWLIPVIVVFFSFIGWSFLESRVVVQGGLESLKNEGRWKLWYPLLDLAQKFPIFGTGFGTFLQAEQLVRLENLQGLTVDYAHNEYLEALIEGGIIRLFLTLAMAVVVIQKTITALKIHRNESHALLPVGICWGLSALAIHSFVDFGLHLPAISITAVVLLAKLHCLCDPLPPKPEEGDNDAALQTGTEAQIANVPADGGPTQSMTSNPSGRSTSSKTRERRRVRKKTSSRKIATENQADHYGIYIAGFLLLTFIFILGQSVVYARVESLMVASRSARAKGDTGKEIAYLNSALKIAPANALVHEALGISLALIFNDDVEGKKKLDKTTDVLSEVDALMFMPFADPVGLRAKSGIFLGLAALSALKEKTNKNIIKMEQEKQKHFKSAVVSLEKARYLFPILYRVHANLAILAPIKDSQSSEFRTDLPSVHLKRALLCFPIDSDLQYSMGQSALMEGDLTAAADHFNNALKRSNNRLAEILSIAKKHYTIPTILNYILPPDPELVLRSLPIIAPRAGSEERVRVLLKVLNLVSENRGTLEPRLLVAIFSEMDAAGILPSARLEIVKNLPLSLIKEKSVSLEIAAAHEEAGQFVEALPYVLNVLEKDAKNERAKEILIAIKRYCKIFDVNFDDAVERIKRER